MGSRLGPVATDFHRAPLTRVVPGGVIERPPAVVRRTDLDPIEALLDGNLRGGRGDETDNRVRTQLDLAVIGQRHLYPDPPSLLMTRAAGQRTQVVTQLASLPEITHAFAPKARVQALRGQPRLPGVDRVQHVGASLDVQGVDEPHDQVRGVAAEVETDELSRFRHVTTVA